MLHVANLYPEWFEPTLAGTKTVEIRDRADLDPTLDAIAPGHLVVFRETGGSDRAVLCVIAGSSVRRLKNQRVRYRIRLRAPRLVTVRDALGRRPPLRQGWRVVELLDTEFLRHNGNGAMRLKTNVPSFTQQLLDAQQLGDIEVRLPW